MVTINIFYKVISLLVQSKAKIYAFTDEDSLLGPKEYRATPKQ